MTGLPGSYEGAGSSMRAMRDKMNVDDIDGAIPRRLVGVSNVKFVTVVVYWSKT